MFKKFAAAFLCALTLSASAACEERVFALVPKLQHPFFEIVHQGCMKAEKELAGVRCLYVGPAKSSEEEQIQILQDLITKKVAGIAVSPANAPAVAKVLKRAQESRIPIITFDSDLLDRDAGLRKSYVGTNNYEIGVSLAKRLLELKPGGGTYAIQSGGPAAANLQERIKGVRDTLGGSWREAAGTPVYCNDDSALAVQQMEDLLGKYSKLDAFIAVGGWPQFADRAYRLVVDKHRQRFESGQLALIIADTLPMQMQLLRDGLSSGQVGQRPFEMGYRSIVVLNNIADGRPVDAVIHTGLDVCTRANAESCAQSEK